MPTAPSHRLTRRMIWSASASITLLFLTSTSSLPSVPVPPTGFSLELDRIFTRPTGLELALEQAPRSQAASHDSFLLAARGERSRPAADRYIESLPFGREIRGAATRYGVDSLLLASVVEAESGFRPDAVSNKGALGLIKVEGSGDKTVFSGKTADNVYMPEGGAIQKVVDKEQVATASTLEDQLKFGKTIYAQNCAACHQPDGKGIVGAFPPLASSDFFNADWKRSIDVVKNGLSGAVTVNGQLYNGVMPALGLSDEDISNVLTYISHSWGNKKRIFKKPEVSSVSTRKDKGGGH